MSSILLIEAGGTIASVPDDNGVLVARPGKADLIDLLPPEVRAGVESRLGFSGLSPDMQFSDVMGMVRMIHEAIAAGVQGIIVTHGTDTMEEVSFLVDLFLTSDVPVIFTGAQRAASAPGADGLANLNDAIAVARHPMARGIGTAIVFGGGIYPARSARKIDSNAPEAFGPHGSAIGRVNDREVRMTSTPIRRPAFPLVDPEPRVEIAAPGLGSTSAAIRSLVESGVRGLVVEGFGRGNVPAGLIPEMASARAGGILTGIATSCTGGGTAASYMSGARLAAAGIIGAADLSARKLRLLFSVALAATTDVASAQRQVENWLAPAGSE